MPNGVTKSSFGALLVDSLPSLHVWPEGTLVFPLHKYPAPAEPGELFGAAEESDQQSFNIGQVVLHDWSEICGTEIAAEDAFYYCYGVLHSPIYRSRFEADLKKQIPRVPAPRSQETFALFADAGRALGDMHLNYESIEPYDQLKHEVSAGHSLDDPATLRVEKMRYGKTSGKVDKTTPAFNEAITITGIPETTHSYRLGSRSALDWLVDRYAIRTDSKSSIVNDPNEWATEVGDPRYILDLVGRIVEVSVRTVTIMEDLPDPMA